MPHPIISQRALPQYLSDHRNDSEDRMRALQDEESRVAINQSINQTGDALSRQLNPLMELLNTGGRLRDGVASAGMAGYEGEYGEAANELGQAVRSLLPRKMYNGIYPPPESYPPASRDWRKLDKFNDDEGNPNWLSTGAEFFTDPEVLLGIGMLGKTGVKQLMRKAAR